jgi:hypothetical protein
MHLHLGIVPEGHFTTQSLKKQSAEQPDAAFDVVCANELTDNITVAIKPNTNFFIINNF